MVFAQVKIGGPKGLVARLELLAQRDVGAALGLLGGQRVKVAPQRAANEAHALQHHALLLQPDQTQPRAGVTQPRCGLVKLQSVVFMVAGNEEHRRWPAGTALRHRQRRKSRQAKVGNVQAGQQGAVLVGADVADQHQQVGAGRGRGLKVRIGFKVQVGKKLDVHRTDCAAGKRDVEVALLGCPRSRIDKN